MPSDTYSTTASNYVVDTLCVFHMILFKHVGVLRSSLKANIVKLSEFKHKNSLSFCTNGVNLIRRFIDSKFGSAMPEIYGKINTSNVKK